ncbi:MAG: ATPase P, partial [Proteobacteria bacterium]
IADRISNVFVPAVVVVALLTLLGNYLWFDQDFQASLLRSIAVLVIACPCAMGLATPAAVMVGIGQAARNGVLFRGGDSVEKLAGVRAMVFDKTGTLTTGMFKVKEIKTFGPPEDFVKSVLLGLEHHSSHPIAQSIVREFAGIQPHPFRSHDEIKGLGVRARDERGSEFQAGSYASLNDTSVEPGHSLYLSENGKVIAWVDLEDEPREGTEDLIASLRSFGIKSVVLSGDARTKTEALAKRIGIEEVHAEKLPQQKMEILKGLEQENPCAYVGDGINDAPALAQARVGIALSQASESAIQSSQVVLFGGALTKLLSAVVIARRTVAIIKQNLFWAFFYNVLAIPLAAAGFLSPMIGALAMAFSDIIVIANSLRLRSSRALHL